MTMIGGWRQYPYPEQPRFGMDIPQTQQFPAPPTAPAQPLHRITTARPKEKINWLGILGDALAGAMGREGPYAARMDRERKEQTAFERGEREYQRRRVDDRDEWQYRQENERRAPSEFDTMLERAGISIDKRPDYYRRALEAKVDPMANVPLGNGSFAYAPRSAIPSLLGGQGRRPTGLNPPPPEAIADLRNDPSGAAEFDEAFGPGAANSVLGGQPQPATGNFPEPYDPHRPYYR